MFRFSMLSLVLSGLLWSFVSVQSSATGVAAAPPVRVPDQVLESNHANARMRSVAVGDVNGDGFDDLIGGAPFLSDGDVDTEQLHEGAIYVYLGSTAGLKSQPDHVIQSNLHNLDGIRMGFSVASGGDVNGDGYDDVLVGASRYTNAEGGEGAVYVFFGGPGNFDPSPDAILESQQNSAFMGWDVAIAGDVNGDGFDDIIVNAPNYSHPEPSEGAALIYFGGAGAFDTGIDAIIESNSEYNQLYAVAAAGDINGDGYDDVLVGNPRQTNGESFEGAVWLFHGGAGVFDTTADQQFESNWVEARFGFAGTVAGNGDLNGDGLDDLVIGAHNLSDSASQQGAFFVYHNQLGGMDTVPDQQVLGSSAAANLGYALRIVGDIDHDGYDDLAVNVPGLDIVDADEGGTYIYRGGPSGVGATPDLVLRSGLPGLYVGTHLASGDFNGDGEIDLALGAPNYAHDDTDEGALLIKYGPLFGTDPVGGDIFADGFEAVL